MIGIIVREIEIIWTILLMNFGERTASASNKLLLFNDLLVSDSANRTKTLWGESRLNGKNFIKIHRNYYDYFLVSFCCCLFGLSNMTTHDNRLNPEIERIGKEISSSGGSGKNNNIK